MVVRGTEIESRNQNQIRTANVNIKGLSYLACDAFLSHIHENKSQIAARWKQNEITIKPRKM